MQGKDNVTREDREIWDDLDDDERLEAYLGVIDERDAARRPIAEAYDRFKHLDRVFEMVGDTDGTENTDPFHAAARDLWRAVKASLDIPANAERQGRREATYPERSCSQSESGGN